MNVCSIWFLIFVGVVAILFHLFPSQRLRRFFLSAVNVGFLVPLVPNWHSWVGFALLIAGSFLCVRFAKGRPSGMSVFAILALAVAAFTILKRYAFLEWILPTNLWQHPVELIGLSYMLFKFIHVLIDQWQGQLAPCTFFSYANYQMAFFTLLAGPIQRYNDFHSAWEEMDSTPEDQRETLLAWNRLLTGLIKMGGLALIFSTLYDVSRQRLVDYPDSAFFLLSAAAYFYAYPLYLYFNFSGYTDVMIGCGQLFGFKLPENFNHPFLARNVVDFWNRWHISLTHWIRDYVFMTSYKAAAERFPRAGKYLGYVLLAFALFLSGVWHGATGGFAVFGALQGLGAAANQAYGDILKSWLGRAGFQRYQKNKLIHLAAILLTFHFFCFSQLFFSSGVAPALDFLQVVGNRLVGPLEPSASRSLGYVGFVPVIMLPFMLGALWNTETTIGLLDRVWQRLIRNPRALYWVVIAETAFVTVGFFLLWALTQKAPVLIYMRF